MANPQHIEWLLEGVAAWNKRLKRDEFYPDFEAQISSANFPSVTCWMRMEGFP